MIMRIGALTDFCVKQKTAGLAVFGTSNAEWNTTIDAAATRRQPSPNSAIP
jgi:hypothetical protein